jgi:uncharacterized coiled-coil protein SlyX
MSIEQKIAEILAEAKYAGKEGGSDPGTHGAVTADKAVVRQGNAVPNGGETPNPDNARNNVDDEKEAEKAPTGSMNPHNGDQSPIRQGNTVKGVKEDMDALFNGEELTEEFKDKATTIFESAVMVRVKEEVARLEEEFESKLAEQVAQNTEGLVEQVDGYLGYIAEQWMAQNEIALERGIKAEILESFVTGMKSLFEEHYIDVPEEKYDVLGEMEDRIGELEAKLNEQVAANIELSKTISEAKRTEIIKSVSEGLTDLETEKFLGLAEELSYEDAETFESKVKTIRENYFTTKQSTIVESVVTDAPVELLSEEKKTQIDPTMTAYLSALNKSFK